MLKSYRKDYQKIVMGILSFVPQLHDVERVRDEIAWSLQQGYHIYLWHNADEDHFTGVAIIQEGDNYVLVRWLSFTPSERSGRNVYGMLTAIAQLFPRKRVMGTFNTQPLITNWERETDE
ncbi:reductase [Limosilactobacillus difficilis]|uniref:reductase n=1 Tax=Limosilactobacillus difficilis TaxID=2991838 RepID=UPI0024BBE9A2|nr:reductase [Limosilactobacillus difficilis]